MEEPHDSINDNVTKFDPRLMESMRDTVSLRPARNLQDILTSTRHFLADYRTLLLWINDSKTDFQRADLLTKFPAETEHERAKKLVSEISDFIGEESTAEKAMKKLENYRKKIASRISPRQVMHASTVELDIENVEECITILKRSKSVLDEYVEILHRLTHGHPIQAKQIEHTINIINELLNEIRVVWKKEAQQDAA